VVALLYAVSSVATPSPAGVQALLGAVAGTVLLTAFVVRAVHRGPASLIDLRLFTNRSFLGGAVMAFVLGVTTWGPMFLLPLYYQQLRQLSAFEAGLMLAPQSIGLGLAFLVVGRYVDRMPPRPLALAGLAVAAAATVPFAVACSDPVVLGGALLVRGIGIGVASLPISVALYRTLRPVDIPGATSASNVIQRIGAATGTALLAIVLQTSGFTPALIWMLVLTTVGLAAAVLLPGRSVSAPTTWQTPAAAPMASTARS